MKILFISLILLSLICPVTIAWGEDFHVKVGGVKSSGASVSWELTECYGTIKKAVDASSAGDRILVENEVHTISTADGILSIRGSLLNRNEDADYSS